jgi:DNA mismatch repair protein MutS2
VPGKGISLSAVRHPLLEKRLASSGRRMTPLDFRISPEAPLVVISGLNAGGKTVALKTLGLSVLLARTGLFVPCGPGSSMDFPERVLAVMGDNQDLEGDLSTFSGHVRALKPVLRLSGPGTLVLLDELGGGTDPSEGQALALAVLEELSSSGAWIVSATHFHLVKTWASLNPSVVSAAVNSSADGSPSYGLSYGSPGFSGGLGMAERLGLPKALVDRARSYLDEGHRNSLELLRKLEEARAGHLGEAEKLAALRKTLAREAEAAKAASAKEAARQERLRKEADLALRSFMSRYRAAFESLKSEIKAKLAQGERLDPNLPVRLRTLMDRDAAAVRPAPPQTDDPELRTPESVKPGDRVFIRKLGMPGTVHSWDSEKREGTVQSGRFMLKATLDELAVGASLSKKNRKPTSGVVNVDLAPPPEQGVPGSLVVVGRTVAEAVDILDREIDSAVAKGRANLTVIHGRGTGRLREGIAEYLKKHPQVRGFVTPEKPPGRGGITEVTLEI